MATIPSGKMSAEELCVYIEDSQARPESIDLVFELDEGDVVETPLHGAAHGFVCANVGYFLSAYCQDTRIGFACLNMEIVLARRPDTVRRPDVAVFGIDGYEQMLVEEGFTSIVPMLVVEVASPSDNYKSITRKIRQYQEAGVKRIWIIDPADRAVMMIRPNFETETYHGDGELTGGDVLPGLIVNVADLFRKPGEK